MRRFAFLLPFAAAVCFPPHVAHAAVTPLLSSGKGWYLSGKGGPTFSELSNVGATQSGNTINATSAHNVIGSFGMAGGYEWMYHYHIPLRTELEFMNRTEVTYDASPLMKNGTSGALASTAQNVTTMAKFYWHFPVGSRKWWPFLSAGVGWSHNTFKAQYTPTGGGPVKTKATTNDLAWSAGVGASLKLGEHMTNDIELRYVDLGKADWGMPADHNIDAGRFSATELSFAIRFNF